MLREWQKRIIRRLTEGLESYKVVSLDAPTGSGKTIIALKLAENQIEKYEKVYFFTRTISQISSPLRDLRKFQISLKPAVLIGKERTCVFRTTLVRCSKCPYRNQRVRVNVEKLLEEIEESISKKRCVYLGLKDAVKEAELVILPYTYSKPSIAKRLELDFSNSLLIFDEAHNLFSFTTEFVIDIKYALKVFRKLPSILEVISKRLGLPDLPKMVEILPLYEITHFLQKLLRLSTSSLVRVEDVNEISFLKLVNLEPLEELISFLTLRGINVSDILQTYGILSSLKEGIEQDYSFYYKENKLLIKQLFPWLKYVNSKNMLLMSGTMPSKEFLEKILGSEVFYLSVTSDPELAREYFRTFPPNSLEYLVVVDVTTKYTERFKSEIREAIERIEEFVFLKAKASNTIALLVYPSYAYLKFSITNLLALSKKYDVYLMINERRKGEYLLEEAKSLSGSAVIAAVAGDTITEGVEVTNEEGKSKINLVAIIGAPFPSPSLFTKDLAKKIDKNKWREIEWRIYEEEMIMRTKQAIGRIRRSPKDKGLVILADSRFLKYVNKISDRYKPITTNELYLIMKRGGSIH